MRKQHPELNLPDSPAGVSVGSASPSTRTETCSPRHDLADANLESDVAACSRAQLPSLHGGRCTPETPISYRHRQFEYEPFMFEWDEYESDDYDSTDNDLGYDGVKQPQSPQSKQDADEWDEEWDERRGWGPYDEDDHEDESDSDLKDSDDDPEDPDFKTSPAPGPQSRTNERGENGNAAPPFRREYISLVARKDS